MSSDCSRVLSSTYLHERRIHGSLRAVGAALCRDLNWNNREISRDKPAPTLDRNSIGKGQMSGLRSLRAVSCLQMTLATTMGTIG